MTSPLDPPFLLLYASIGGAIWFAIAARRRGCIATLTVVATISFFNGMLIAAIKVLPEHVANDPDLKQRFEREAQIPPSDLTAAMPNRLVLGWLIASIGIGVLQGGHVAHAQPTFRTGVDLVSVTAVVSDKEGRPVRELTRNDFQVFDDGERRPVLEFWADDAAALSLALLFDVSGSMHVGSKMADARSTANVLLARLRQVRMRPPCLRSTVVSTRCSRTPPTAHGCGGRWGS